MKKYLFLLMVLVVLMISLVGCTSNTTPEGTTPENTTPDTTIPEDNLNNKNDLNGSIAHNSFYL